MRQRPPSDAPRSERIEFRVSTEEKQRIRELAESAGMTVGTYIAVTLLGDELPSE